MALTDENTSGVGTTMLVSPTGGNFGGGFGNDWSWLIVLFLFGMFNGGWGGFGGGYGNGMLGIDFPWLLNGQNGINSNTNDGFRDLSLTNSINGIQNAVTSGFGDVQTALCGGFAGVNATVNGAQNALAQQMNANEVANLNRSFAEQTANIQGFNGLQSQLATCCCENRAATADVKYTIATEACANRATSTANTQAILDKLCELELNNAKAQIEAKNDTINQLRSELIFARGQASQDVQTAAIQAGQRALANEVEQYVAPSPKPAYIVQNPNCCTNMCGCGV